MPDTTAPDFDAVLNGISQVGGPRLRVDVILDALPPDQCDKVLKALHDLNVSDARIGKALSKMGQGTCSEGAVTKWRERHDVT